MCISANSGKRTQTLSRNFSGVGAFPIYPRAGTPCPACGVARELQRTLVVIGHEEVSEAVRRSGRRKAFALRWEDATMPQSLGPIEVYCDAPPYPIIQACNR